MAARRRPPAAPTAPPAAPPAAPERWQTDAGDGAEAVLQVPASLGQERRFEVSCSLQVRCPATLEGAWFELSVLADGALQWQRRIAAANPGQTDSLDYRFARSVPAGQALRLVLRSRCQGVQRQRLWLQAEQD